MAEKRQLEFFLLRYVPDAVKDEFVNIGLVMIEASANGAGFADLRFTRDWRRVLCLDPQADIEMLQALESEIRKQVVEVRNCESIMRVLNDSYSNLIQLSSTKGCLTLDPSQEIEKMAKMYLERMRGEVEHALTGRQTILLAMRGAWEQAGVTKFLNPFATADYKEQKHPVTFDFGYRVGDEIKLFHAVSVRANVDSALMLAARYPEIRDAIENAPVEKRGRPVLMAVVENGLDRSQMKVDFALDQMQQKGILVHSVAEMPSIAASAKLELRA
jgi:Protein of unknown function (DUF3037)